MCGLSYRCPQGTSAVATQAAPSRLPDAPSRVPALPSRDQTLDNIAAFARLVGYLRYFHPSDQAQPLHWESFVEQGIQAVAAAQDSHALAQILGALVQVPAPTVRVFPIAEHPPAPAVVSSPSAAAGLHVVAWRHHGFGAGDPYPGSPYASERVRHPAPHASIPADVPDPQQPLYVELGAGVACLVPLALWADDQGTLPHATSPRDRTTLPASQLSAAQVTRLATVTLAWNVSYHFYPYVDVVDVDWSHALRDSLAAYDATTDDQFYAVLQRLVAQLHDGHGFVENHRAPRRSRLYRPPVGWDWVEDHLVITFVEPDAADRVQRGAIVTQVNGQPTATAMAAQTQLVSGATPQWVRTRVLQELLLGPYNTSVTLALESAGGELTTATLQRTVAPASDPFNFLEQRPAPVTELRPGLWYVDLTRIDDRTFEQRLPELTAARGVVFDLRGYPTHITPDTLGHLVDQPIQSARWRVPIITVPQRPMTFEESTWSVEPRRPRLTGRVAFLTDGRAISYAETYLGMVEAHGLGDIVGSPTAGTNGNISTFTVAGYSFVFTGMHVLKQDGAQHHGVGIQPSVSVGRTRQGPVRATVRSLLPGPHRGGNADHVCD